MSDIPRNPTEHLISQDPGLDSFPYSESHRRLESALRKLERRDAVTRRLSYWGLGIIILCLLLILPLEWIFSNSSTGPNPFFPYTMGCFYLVLFATVVLTYLSQHHYRPLIDRKTTELHRTMIADLQRQVAELSDQQGRRKE